MTENHQELANALRSADASRADDGVHIADALRLVVAFMRIRNPAARHSIIDVVERIADGCEDPPPG